MFQSLRRYLLIIRLKFLGHLRLHRLLNKHGGCYTKKEVARYLCVSMDEVMAMNHSGELLAFCRFSRWYFPVWQFKEHKVVPGFDLLLQRLCNFTAFSKIRFFLLSDPLLGMTRIEALRNNYKINQLIEEADCFYIHGA